MSLIEQLDSDLRAAMLARDEARKQAIRAVKTAAANALVAKRSEASPDVELDDKEVLALIAQQAKQRRDSIAAYGKAGRKDLVAEEQAELAVLEEYLPQMMARDQIEEIVTGVIASVGASGPKDMGLVMQPVMKQLKDRADGRLVNQVVRELLAGERS